MADLTYVPVIRNRADYAKAQRRLAELRSFPSWTALDTMELADLSKAVREYDAIEALNAEFGRESEHG